MDAAFSFACASRCASSAVTEDRQALYAEQIRPVIEPVCRTQAIELEKAFQANDALWATFSQKTEARRTAATVAPSGLVASGVLGALEQETAAELAEFNAEAGPGLADAEAGEAEAEDDEAEADEAR